MAQSYAELEIVLRWRKRDDVFDIGLAYDDPSDPQDRRDYVDKPLKIDTDELAGLVADHTEYGRRVGTLLLGIPKVREFYAKALATAANRDIRLHFRLLIDPRAPLRYHSIRWEAMRDPDGDFPIATRRNILLSRYLSTPDWRPVRPPPWGRLTALLAIANPSDLVDRDRVGMPGVPLHPIDVADELARARDALHGLNLAKRVELVDPGEATLERILAELGEGVDLFYLVCHGGIAGDQPMLYLDDGAGASDVVGGRWLAERVADLERPPTVAVLCSCQSAGPGDEAMARDGGTLSAVGVQLSGAGVGAVVGMQGNVTMRTAARFFPAFLSELSRHGVVDRAMAFARGEVRDREQDWWMPVLYTRLRLGRAWYEPEFGDRTEEAFKALVGSIRTGRCTPVVGSGVGAERILPSREQFAESWAEQWLMPIASQNRTDLAKVAQYLSVRVAPGQTHTQVLLYLANELRQRYAEELPADLRESDDVGQLIQVIGEQHRRRAGADDPYAILASLKLPIYVTTSWTHLLEDAIRDAGRKPHVRNFDWYESLEPEDDLPEPSPDEPLVFHLFGSLDDPDSLVVTEDHYLQWLTAWIRVAEKPESIPPRIAKALTSRALMFVGYRLDDWEFRILFQSVKSFPAAEKLLRRNLHVGVQVSPESTVIEPESVQDYLARYFDESKVRIYWGTCTQFLTTLANRMRVQHG